MKFNAILLDIASAVAAITLSRPDKLNSFTGEMHEELKQAMQIIRADASVRVLMITGAGRGFCAGQDLSERMRGDGEQPFDVGNSLDKNYNPLLKQLRALPYPVLCAVNGVAAGAGCNLVLACDIVIAARSATFIQAFSRIGWLSRKNGRRNSPVAEDLAPRKVRGAHADDDVHAFGDHPGRQRRLLVRYEKTHRSYLALNMLPAAIICSRKVPGEINIIYG